MDTKLFIAMVGLPARGKSMVARKIMENLEKEGIRIQVFNNGDVRRRLLPQNNSHADFYDPDNAECSRLREEIALVNIYEAKNYLAEGGGQVAILDATNISRTRRNKLRCHLAEHPLLFIECINTDKDLVAAGMARKTGLSEFAHLTPEEAFRSLEERIALYQRHYDPLEDEYDHIIMDSLNNRIIKERVRAVLPYYPRIRDIVVSDWVKSLFLVRHGQSEDNLRLRIGGNSPLTDKGLAQAQALARHFAGVKIPYVFRSTRLRTRQMAGPLLETQEDCQELVLNEFDEINAGICEGMTYQEIQEKMPEEYAARSRDKYNYVYPEGEGYVTLHERVDRGLKKVFYLSGNAENILIVGHQAVNRMILSHFLFRRTEDVPHIYIPQDKYFHIISTQAKKLFELKPFSAWRQDP